MVYNHYNGKRGWEDTNPKWHEISIPCKYEATNAVPDYEQVILWLYEHIDNCERHCRWYFDLVNRAVRIKFRYEKDYILCTLRWS